MPKEKNQHQVFVIGFSLIVLVILWFLLKPFVSSWRNGKANQDDQKANAEILKAPSVMPDDIFLKIQKNEKIFLVDVSSPDDFKRGHIAKTVNVPGEKFDVETLKSLGAEKTSDILVMNQGGDLAELAAMVNKIVSEGFVNTKYLRGGISGWREKGFPLVSLGGSEVDGSKVKKISIDDIKKTAEVNQNILQFLDVRDKNSFAKEHIIGAINIPLSELEMKKDEVPTVKEVIVYGANENEGFQAAVALFDLNFFNVYQMEGGIDDWKNAGGNVITGN